MRVFVTQPITESALARLRQVGEVEVHPDASKPIEKACTRSPVNRLISPTTVLLSVPPERKAPVCLGSRPLSACRTAFSVWPKTAAAGWRTARSR